MMERQRGSAPFGHRETTETFFTLQMLRALGEATGKATRLVDARKITSAEELAANALRKLLPPNSTIHLPPFDLAADDYKESCRDMVAKLQKIEFQLLPGKKKTSNFLEAARANRVTFSARQWQDFNDALDDSPSDPWKAVWAFAREAKMRLSEAGGLDSKQMRLVTEAITVAELDDGNSGAGSWKANKGHCWLDASQFRAQGTMDKGQVIYEEARSSIECIPRQRMRLTSPDGTAINYPAANLVSCLHDLLRLALDENMPAPDYPAWFVCTTWYLDEHQTSQVVWESPPWQSFAQIRAFEQLWTRCCDWVAHTPDRNISLQYAWLALGQAIVGGHPLMVEDSLSEWFDHPPRSIKDPNAAPLLPIMKGDLIDAEAWKSLAEAIAGVDLEQAPQYEWLLRVSTFFLGGAGMVRTIWEDHFRAPWEKHLQRTTLLMDLTARIAIRQRKVDAVATGFWGGVIAPRLPEFGKLTSRPPQSNPLS